MSAVKFWNRMVDSNSNNDLCDVMKADIFFGAYNFWNRQMKDAFGDMQNGTVCEGDFFTFQEAKYF